MRIRSSRGTSSPSQWLLRIGRNAHLAQGCTASRTEAKPPVVLYDGNCVLCRRSAETLQRRIDANVVLVDFRKVDPQNIHPSLSIESLEKRMHVVVDDCVYAGAAAVAMLLRKHPMLRLFAWMIRVPPLRGIAEYMYDWVSAHRYILSTRMSRSECDGDACRLHIKNTESQKTRIRRKRK